MNASVRHPRCKALAHFPWATYGRREAAQELFQKCEEQSGRVALLSPTPLFSVVIPIEKGGDTESLLGSLESLELQSYPRWEAVLVGEPGMKALEAHLPSDLRYRWIEAAVGSSLVDKKNRGAKEAKGEWLGFLDSGDVLAPSAFFTLALELQEGASELFYSHEAFVNSARNRVTRFFSKARYGWFNLVHLNAIGKSWWVRRARFDELGGVASEAGVHHEHDFLLRLSERTEAFRLIPAYLTYRRSEAPLDDFPADSLLQRRVEQHLERRDLKARVLVDGGSLRVTPLVSSPRALKISVIVCFRNRADWTSLCLESLGGALGEVPIEVWAVDNGSSAEERERVAQVCRRLPFPAEVVDYEGPFNFGRMHNVIVRKHCRGQFLLLLNNDVFWQKGLLDELVGWAQQPWAGTIGTLLRFPHGGVQHAGFRAFFGGPARLARIGHNQRADRFSRESHEVFGNTFAACLMKRATFDSLGGLRECDVPNGFGDVAFNFECSRAGLRNLYLGGVEGVHLESASRGAAYEYWEENFIERRYPDLLQRMLREDLGYDRVPGEDYSVPQFLKEAALAKLRDRAPWLKPLKVEVKKVVSRLKHQPTFSLDERLDANSDRPTEV